MHSLREFLRDAWKLTRPYFMQSEERLSAWGLLITILVLNLALVGMSVVLNFWHRAFYNALQEKDWQAFLELLFLYRRTSSGLMPGFSELAAVYIAVAVYAVYLNQWLQIRWRRWMTTRFLDDWMKDRAYYHISLSSERAAIGTDNPDQRIAEDLRDFTRNTLSLTLDLVSNIVTLGSFVGILWGLSGPINLLGVTIPGYMVWVALIYAVLGSWLTHLIGRPLAALNFRQQRVEADFRYALVRVRENVEGIALYRGENEEQGLLKHRFGAVIGNWWAIMRRNKMLNTLIYGYSQLAGIFPIVVASPGYFFGAMQLGGLMQTVGAFGQVQGAMSWFISVYAGNNPADVSLTRWRSIVERLTTFHAAIVRAQEAAAQSFSNAVSPDQALHLNNVTIAVPNGNKLLDGVDLVLESNHSVLITGRTGSGKSTLFRVIAGIWPFGHGNVQLPKRAFFLPQRAYLPLGTLRHVVAYPHAPETFKREDFATALRDVGLPQLVDFLDRDENWSLRLSGGEQQRVAVARALMVKPDWIFMDEATASLDPEAEADLYRILREKLPNTTVVSIGHSPTLARFHDRHLTVERTEGAPGHLTLAAVEPAAGE